jgi:parallel beta-helix repeat protein
MNRKRFIIILTVFALLTLNFSAAHEIDNSTNDDLQDASSDAQVLKASDENIVAASSKLDTHIDVESNTTFDAIGDYFKVKLSDENNKSIANTKLTFKVDGKSYSKNTDSKGIASLQLKLKDGTHKIVTKFAGNSNYRASSLTTTITMNNTRVVESGLSNAEIQNIIDNAKVNNVILFKGKSYSDINLVITKSLSLVSNVGTTLKSGSLNPTITIKGKNASLTSIKGFNIEGKGDGIGIQGCDYVTIYGNDITAGGNGIVATQTKYLNITNNNVVKNSKSGILVGDSSNLYIFNNRISNNGDVGLGVAKVNKVYIDGNIISNNKKQGVYLTNSINGVDYAQGPKNIHINKNTVSKNGADGIEIKYAGDNINIKSNTVEANHENGVSLGIVGTNTIQSNVIKENWENGIRFYNNYVQPKSQEISYNAVFSNLGRDVEAKETYYQENGIKLEIGDNWYTDYSGVCPKVSTKNIKFSVKQIGENKFQAAFTDSNGNIASLLPDRTLTVQTNNGQKVNVEIKGGAAVFTVDANDGDLVKATVDQSRRDNTYDSKTVPSSEINGESPAYEYPPIPQYDLYGDIGGGNGNGNGGGSNGNANNGNGQSQQGDQSNGNGSYSQQADPSSNPNNPVNDVSQSSNADTASQEGASQTGAGPSNSAGSSGSKSVVKQIIIDEDDFVRVAGISFIVLLIILTVGFYYRDDIREMKSKMQ